MFYCEMLYSYEYDETMSWNDSEALFKAVVENDLDKLKELLDSGANINAVSADEVQ